MTVENQAKVYNYVKGLPRGRTVVVLNPGRDLKEALAIILFVIIINIYAESVRA